MRRPACLSSKGLCPSSDDKAALPFKCVWLFVKRTQTQKGRLQWLCDEAEDLPVWGLCHEKMFCKGQRHASQERVAEETSGLWCSV